MTKSLRLIVAASLFPLAAIGSAESVVARLARGTLATEVAKRHGMSLKGVTGNGRYALFSLPDNVRLADRIAALRADKGISAVERDERFRTVQSTPNRQTFVQKGSTVPVVGDRYALQVANEALLDMIGWDPALAVSSGRSVRIAILDTGLAENAVELWEKTVASENFVEKGLALDQPTGIDSSGEGIPDEALGHGTVVAGTVDMVAPKVDFVIARVADSDGVATTWTLIRGLDFARRHGAEVVNLSLASAQRSMLIDRALREAELAGITLVAAVGNDNRMDAYHPADAQSVVGVSALDVNRNKASFSNWHPTVDVAAPGDSLIGRYWTGEQIHWAGTSFATAFVSGAVADCLRRTSPKTPQFVRDSLRISGQPVPDPTPEYYGRLGRLLNIRALDRRLRGW